MNATVCPAIVQETTTFDCHAMLKRSNTYNIIRKPNTIRMIMEMHADISLAGGWGDALPPPFLAPHVASAACDPAAFHAATRYTNTAGEMKLRIQIAAKLEPIAYRRVGLTPENISLVSGGSTEIGYALLTLLGDAKHPFITPCPLYCNYQDQADLCGVPIRRVPIIGQDGEFLPNRKPDAVLRDFERYCEEETPGAILLVSPDNPTGGIYSDDFLDRLIGMAERHGVPVVLDRAYAPFHFGDAPEYLQWSCSTHANLITVESMSKAWSLLGLRIGYAVAPRPITDALAGIYQRISLCPSRLDEIAVADAFEAAGEDEICEYLAAARAAYARSYRLALDALRAAFPGVDSIEPAGGFYIMVRVPRGADDSAFCERLHRTRSILAVPGSAFGPSARGWVRTAFAPHVRNDQILLKAYTELGLALREELEVTV